MLVTVEVLDDDARSLARSWSRGLGDELPSEEEVASGLTSLIMRYAQWPEVVTEKHMAAMAILRDKAMERAIQCAQPGENNWNIESRAESILRAVLSPR